MENWNRGNRHSSILSSKRPLIEPSKILLQKHWNLQLLKRKPLRSVTWVCLSDTVYTFAMALPKWQVKEIKPPQDLLVLNQKNPTKLPWHFVLKTRNSAYWQSDRMGSSKTSSGFIDDSATETESATSSRTQSQNDIDYDSNHSLDSAPYVEGEKVLAYHNTQLYDAKVFDDTQFSNLFYFFPC